MAKASSYLRDLVNDQQQVSRNLGWYCFDYKDSEINRTVNVRITSKRKLVCNISLNNVTSVISLYRGGISTPFNDYVLRDLSGREVNNSKINVSEARNVVQEGELIFRGFFTGLAIIDDIVIDPNIIYRYTYDFHIGNKITEHMRFFS